MSATVNLKAIGLNFSPNALELQEGSLLEASNVIIKRDNVVESRRGFNLYGTAFPSSDDRAKQLLSYKNTLLRHYSNILQFDSDGAGTFLNFAGNYLETEIGLRIKSIVSNGNFYFTTSDGIKKISASSSNQFTTAADYITNAGGVKAIDFTGSIVIPDADQSGFLPQDSVVAYRHVWGIKDANTNLILGTPSQSIIVYNPLLGLLIPDMMNMLAALDAIQPDPPTTFFNFGQYVNTYGVPYNATPEDVRTSLINLVTQIDNDILYADQVAAAPLQISPVPTIGSGVCTITFSSGDASNYFSTGSKIFLTGFTTATDTINGAQVVTGVSPTTITFNTTATGPVSTLFATIVSNTYTSITQPGVPNVPATDADLVAIQTYLQTIISDLQQENSFVIPTGNLNTYILPLSITTSANVKLVIDIPQDVTPQHFLQIYRSNTSQATGAVVLTDLTPDDEMQLVYEAFPTSAELSARQMTVIDITPDIFKGANLYTNAASGEGILQANDVPPFAKDINSFKNVVFYANTKTRHRIVSFNLLGVSNMIADYNNGIIPTITISNGITSNTYTFVIGVQEVTSITTTAKASIVASSYFDINSADDVDMYRIWYDTTGSDPAPAAGGRTLVKVDISPSFITTATDVAEKTRDILNGIVVDFSATSLANVITVTNANVGYTTDATAGTSGFTISVLTQGTGESVANKQILLSTVTSVAQAVDQTARSLVHIINEVSTESIYGFYLSGPGQVPGKMSLESRQLSDIPFYIIANNSNTGLSFNPDLTPHTVISAVGAITVANPTQLTVPAHGFANNDQVIITASNSTPSIDGIHTVTVTGVNTFTIPVNVTAVPSPAKFSISELTDAVVSENEVKPNRVYYSKLQQPEAVPILNFLDIGASDKGILRIFPLRDSLFVFKEDGLFRISGETAPFYVSLFDSSCILIPPDSVAVSNNLIYGWTKQGISTVSESGVITISRPIDTEILKLASASYTDFSTATWGVGYESDNSYTAFTVRETTDSIATIGYRYSNLTNSWTTCERSFLCGIVSPADDKLYVGSGDRNFIEQERKTFDRYDYADRDFSSTIPANAVAGNTIHLLSVTDITAGDVITQNQLLSIFTYNGLLEKLDIDPSIATVNITTITQLANVLTITTSAPHNLSASNTDTVSIQNNTSFPSINDNYVATYVSPTVFEITISVPVVTLVIDGIARLSYLDTLRAVAGDSLRPRLESLASKLDTDPNTVLTNYSTLIAPLTGPITAISTGNPTQITSTAHGLIDGRVVSISASNSIPSINGTFTVDVLNANIFTIPFYVNTAGTTGSFVTLTADFQDLRACFNGIVNNLNSDDGVAFTNYMVAEVDTLQEAVILISNNNSKIITLNMSLDFIVGPITIYKAIDTRFTYAPNTMGDPLGLKHVREATIMFADKAFTNAVMAFSTDLLPEFLDVPFNGDGNGIFGTPEFGGNFFGGGSHPVPFRTYVPRNAQRCRYLLFQFRHKVAREKYSVYGVTLTGEVGLSTRAYR